MGSDEVLSYPIPNPTALEPPEVWERLRRERPAAPVTLPSGDRAVLITRYADVKQVLGDPRFSRQLDAPGAARITDSETGGVFNNELGSSVPTTGEGHRRWRQAVGRWFTAKRMSALRPEIEAMGDRLVDEMVAGGQPADLKAAFGFPLPVWVICHLLGVPAADRDRFSHWSDAMLNLSRYSEDELRTAQADFVGYLTAHVAAKRAQPRDDLLSTLVTEGAMTDAQLVATGLGLLVAGHETTANMIGKMVGMLLSDRSRWERLLDDPALVRTAVEEALRFDANPGIGLPRYLTEDTELSTGTLPAGTTVMCSMAAANRDETAFERSAEMDLERAPNAHLAFGVGAHSCLGQALARTELQVALEVLLRRLPGLALAVAPANLAPVHGLVVGGLSRVPVRW
ncbi:cytochrome P450 [Actinosynnema sp. NPDC047251]|uniref:Cytochrome P450 family protein n=1 Tax=Saccharothrix espanaensis (strain ATCC 51144 / DSM 44229 / JCM 9112 / NBRC 15066 / NRRL 15764) TaxID=1179773 RepID=K0K2R0_SACES|nr:cytochrome P450 [Saccharothrix espanaensis]CCH31129.1 Cytochrome P450 family protein [Saccharothrix espanaensis DSM 44229]